MRLLVNSRAVHLRVGAGSTAHILWIKDAKSNPVGRSSSRIRYGSGRYAEMDLDHSELILAKANPPCIQYACAVHAWYRI